MVRLVVHVLFVVWWLLLPPLALDWWQTFAMQRVKELLVGFFVVSVVIIAVQTGDRCDEAETTTWSVWWQVFVRGKEKSRVLLLP